MKDLVGSRVTVSVPARPDFVHVLRAVTAGVAARLDLAFDEIDDLRIAVDEACAHLLGVAEASALTLALTPSPDGLEILASIDGDAAEWPPRDVERTLTWQVLSALADETVFEEGERGPTLRLVKRLRGRSGAPGETDDALR